MDIIIAGVGGVGFRLAKALSYSHNVIVMDKNTEALAKLQESIDVLTIGGDVEDPKTYSAFLEKSFDLFIAVTDSDETNIISSLIAEEKIEVHKKIVRLRNEFFAQSSIAEKVGITDAVFPFELTAYSVKALLDFPKANNVKAFCGTSLKLISVRVFFEDETKQKSISNILNEKVCIVGVDRDKKFFIPSRHDSLAHGDMIYLFGSEEEIKSICPQLNTNMPNSIKNIVIFGAGALGIEVAKVLSQKGINIKMVAKDIPRCNNAAEILQNRATVINSKYGDSLFYEEEGLKNADMVITTSNNDEENIVKCMEAKEQGIKKVVAINNDITHYNLMHSLGMMVVRGPKINAYYSILELIGSSSIVREKLFCGGAAIGFIREVFNAERPLKPIEGDDILVFIIKDDEIFHFSKDFVPQEKSTLMCFCARKHEQRCREWINSL